MLRRYKRIIHRLLRDDRGATAAEYAVIIVAIILTILAAILFLQDELINAFSAIGVNVGQFGKID